MIYLDSSVVLAHLLMEERRPSADFWEQVCVSSRLLEYEVWNRIWRVDLANRTGMKSAQRSPRSK